MPTSPDPYAAHRRATDQALGGMACWAGDPLDTHQIAQPSGPERWQLLLGLALFVGICFAIGWWMA